MNTKRKSFAVRSLAVLLTVFLLMAVCASVVPLFVSAADTDSSNYLTYPITEDQINYVYDGYAPIPFLVIQLSFDADGDGVDDNPDGSGEKSVKDPNSECYGEQWCHTTDEDWVRNIFSQDSASLRSYYEYMTYGNFSFYPAEENYGTPNDGVIHIAIQNKHPDVITADGQWFHCFNQAVQAASEYVDFSVFDKNNNGRIDTYELGLCFIIGGYEDSSSSATRSEVFGVHAYYKKYDTNNSTTVDNVVVGNSGFFWCGAISGGAALKFGVFAHELGHYLGAPDLYDYGTKYDNAVSTLSLMASGSHGNSPSHIDAWDMLMFGFYDPTVVTNGEYTLYAKGSTEGTYNIIKICTPNPGEYYLIENRWSAASSSVVDFDDASAFHYGLLIYHVDENIYYKVGDKCNTYNSGTPLDPALVVYHPSATVICNLPPVAFGAGKTWTASAYKFPESKTWYTSMTADEAALLKDLKVEVISDLGTEMKIRISGADYTPNVEWSASAYNETTESFTVGGKIATLAGNTLNDFNITLSEKTTGKEISTQQIKVKEDGNFVVDYTGLTADTAYTYTITADTSNGTITKSNNAYTNVGEVQATYYTISVYKNLKENEKAYNVKVNLGEKFTYTFPMSKSGYAFCGWYLDKELTQKYDMDFTQDEAKDFELYAKWVPTAEVATLKIVDATATNKIFSVNVGETFITPEYAAKDGYEFEGWFADADYTTPFDFSAPVTSTGTVTVYAKWKNLNPETTAEPIQTQATTEAEQTTAPAITDPVDNNGGTTTVIIIVVVAVVVVGGVAGIAVVLGKKKRS